jgi:hypothetical protein
MTPIFYGTVLNGKLNMEDRFATLLRSMEGQRVEVTVRKYHRRRTDQQNRYYFGVVIPILADHTGYTSDEMHDALKAKFLGVQEKGLLHIKSSALLSRLEFKEYVDKIIQWAARDLTIYIPPPENVEV